MSIDLHPRSWCPCGTAGHRGRLSSRPRSRSSRPRRRGCWQCSCRGGTHPLDPRPRIGIGRRKGSRCQYTLDLVFQTLEKGSLEKRADMVLWMPLDCVCVRLRLSPSFITWRFRDLCPFYVMSPYPQSILNVT